MKSNKVLLGLFVGALTLSACPVLAQTGSSDMGSTADFHEIGPANIGGPVSALVVDQSDPTYSTIYAGASTGGLFVRTSNDQQTWERVPMYDENGIEQNIAINSMVQGPDNTIYIGTGTNYYSNVPVRGTGLYRFIPSTREFFPIDGTKPNANYDAFRVFTSLDYISSGDTLFLYAGTYSGLYRWIVVDGDWDEAFFEEMPNENSGLIENLVCVRDRNVVYYTYNNHVYRYDNAKTEDISDPVDITPAKLTEEFSGLQFREGMRIAVAPSASNYVYAMGVNSTSSGNEMRLMVTTDDVNWTLINSTSIRPFRYNSAYSGGTLTVDPNDPKRVYVGGSIIMTGQGYVDGSLYQWMSNSASESMLNSGNFMSTTFYNARYVHSDIQQILPVPVYENGEAVLDDDGKPTYNYFIATLGGVFSTENGFSTYTNLSNGLNCAQITSVAVAPDGSIIAGSNYSGAPFIQARLAHHGGEPQPAWYDTDPNSTMNHNANVLWSGSTGQTAVSSFQQVAPESRRNIFISSDNNGYSVLGRAYADYLDFTNPTTWTIGSPFYGGSTMSAPSGTYLHPRISGSIRLWESDNDSVMRDSITVYLDLKNMLPNIELDTLGWYTLDGERVPINTSTDVIPAGAVVELLSRSHSSYPFQHTLTADHVANQPLYVKDPIVSRALTIAESTEADGRLTNVYFTWNPTDFTKSYSIENADLRQGIYWTPVFSVNSAMHPNWYPVAADFSRDGRAIFVAVYDSENDRSFIARVSHLEDVNYCMRPDSVVSAMDNSGNARRSILKEYIDTLTYSDGSYWFPRRVSSFAVDQRDGEERLFVTFAPALNYSEAESMENAMVVDNATLDNWSFTLMGLPVNNEDTYCSLIEKVTGTYIVGAETGSYYRGQNETEWHKYPYMQGVPVTSIAQQTKNYPARVHEGFSSINPVRYLYSKTKWPNAIYYGTMGRGIFMDMQYVTDTINEILDSADVVGIPTVADNGLASLTVYPNPVATVATMSLSSAVDGNAQIRLFDLNGRTVMVKELGYVEAGMTDIQLDCTTLSRGMYLVNISVGNQTAAAKLMVR